MTAWSVAVTRILARRNQDARHDVYPRSESLTPLALVITNGKIHMQDRIGRAPRYILDIPYNDWAVVGQSARFSLANVSLFDARIA
jgi:hypothetical protein